MVKPRRQLAVLKDAADNHKALLALKEYRGVRVLSLAEYLETR